MSSTPYLPLGVSTDPGVTAVMGAVEADLRPALVAAIDACNAGLAGRTEGTESLHKLAASLHTRVAQIDENARNRARHIESIVNAANPLPAGGAR